MDNQDRERLPMEHLADAVIRQAAYDFVRHCEDEAYLFLTGRSGNDWFLVAGREPLRGTKRNLHKKLLKIFVQKKVADSMSSNRNRKSSEQLTEEATAMLTKRLG